MNLKLRDWALAYVSTQSEIFLILFCFLNPKSEVIEKCLLINVFAEFWSQAGLF